MNLWVELGATAMAAQRPSYGSKIRCGCGSRIGVESDGGVWLAGYEHTPAGTAFIVVATALEDFEDAAERGDNQMVRAVVALFDVANPRRNGDLSTLAQVLPRLRIPPRWVTFDRLGAAPGAPPSFARQAPAGCSSCRGVFDIRQVVSAARRNKRGELLADEPTFINRRSYGFPPEAAARRAALYRSLHAVLLSTHSAP